MLSIEQVYQDIYDNNIKIDYFSALNDRTSFICKFQDNYHICINHCSINNSAKEKCELSEEFAHYMTNTLYSCFSKLNTVSRCEKRAEKYTIKYLINKDTLDYYVFNQKITTIYELAEIFNVTEKLMYKAIELYYS